MHFRAHLAFIAGTSIIVSLLMATSPATAAPSDKAIATTVAHATSIAGFPAGVTRLSGTSRFETAIQVSKQYAPGVPAVFVATGTDFPDALSAAAAAAQAGGPLLLTEPGTLPATVKAEIQRLQPTRIYVLGGTGAVSAAVANSLDAIAPVTRFGGLSRYDTGLAVVDGLFVTATSAIIATGNDFPDALAATGVAGKLGSPVILVDGRNPAVPSDVLNSLTRMGVSDVVIAGGTGVVSNGIATQLASAGYRVTRYGGASRYETTALINAAFFHASTTATTMFLATGNDFPDALAGAALAGRLGAPMFITTAACAPAPIANAVSGLAPTTTVVLGGTAIVSANAANNRVCLPGPEHVGDVSAGAYCAAQYEGWYGYTSQGTLMKCSRAVGDSRLRWRAV